MTMKPLKRTAAFKRFSLPLGLYRVTGDSMMPAIAPGQLLLGWRWGRPRAGRVAVVRRGFHLIKRVSRIDNNGYWLLGDNSEFSVDSRRFGAVKKNEIEAVIIWPRQAAARQSQSAGL